MEPMAATAAVPEPETAPKTMLAATQTIPTPPRSQLNSAEQNWMMRLESPPWFMIAPEIMKKGIAISVKELTPLMKPRQFMYIGRLPLPSSTARKPAPSREKVMGTPRNIRASSEIHAMINIYASTFPSSSASFSCSLIFSYSLFSAVPFHRAMTLPGVMRR